MASPRRMIVVDGSGEDGKLRAQAVAAAFTTEAPEAVVVDRGEPVRTESRAERRRRRQIAKGVITAANGYDPTRRLDL